MEMIPNVAEFPTDGLVDSFDDGEFIKEYICDVCSIARFPTEEEAERHEAACTNGAAASAHDGVNVTAAHTSYPGPSRQSNGTTAINERMIPKSTPKEIPTTLPTPSSRPTPATAEDNYGTRHSAIRFAPKFATKSCLTFYSSNEADKNGRKVKPTSTTHETINRNVENPVNTYRYHDDVTAARLPTPYSHLNNSPNGFGSYSNILNENPTTNGRRKKTPKKSTMSAPTMNTIALLQQPSTLAAQSLPRTGGSGLGNNISLGQVVAKFSPTPKTSGFSNATNLKPKAASRPLKGPVAPILGAPKHVLLAASKPTNSSTSQGTTNMTVGATTSSPTATTTDRKAFVGQRVYAQFPSNSMYYWGIISKVSYATLASVQQQKMSSQGVVTPITYQVWFDDGDVEEGISGKDMITEDEYVTKWQKTYDDKPPPKRPRRLNEYSLDYNGNIIIPTKSSDEGDNGVLVPKTKKPQDLFLEQCGACSMCVRPECGKCESCVRACRNPSRPRGVCFRKMCLEISTDEKAQPAVGFPDGWRFYFTTSEASSTITLPLGLVLISPRDKTFETLDAAMRTYRKSLERKPNLKQDFYLHIGETGADDIIQQPTLKKKVVSPLKKRRRLSEGKARVASPETKRRKVSTGKVKRELPAIKEIGSRVYCRFTNGFFYWGEIVGKKQDEIGNIFYSVRFEDGDCLGNIADTPDDHDDGNIYSEAGFFLHSQKYPSKRPSSSPPTQRSKAEQKHTPPSRKARNVQVGYTTAELYQKRCKTCSSCKMKDCLRCISCTNNRNDFADGTECCLWKMCDSIHKDLKKQSAPGLPAGWTFVSRVGSKLTLISPCGDEFNSFQHALTRYSGEIEDAEAAKVEFETHVGGSLLWNDDEHYLVGKEYCHEWTDVHGRNKVIYGMINSCERDKLDKDHRLFTVTYNEESFDDIVKGRPSPELDFSPTATMALECALGGHLAYASKHDTSLLKEPLVSAFSRRWLTPDMRTDEMVVGSDGKELPRLILVWNGFRLVFTVRQSTIPNAGFGVFVQCTSLVPTRTGLSLKKGEMLDLGVYAPLRKEDLKEECVFLVKNFIMGLKCEEWTFDVGPTSALHQFDITDDWTGELHDIAARRIPAYMNECKMEEKPSVYAELDPEGVLHYMLGARTSDLNLPADGSMVELFINYGPKYERVRIRNNYSFLPPAEQRSHAKSVHQENADYLEEISGYPGPEVTCCVEFVSKIVETGTLPDEFLVNALCVAVALRHRGRMLMDEMGASSPFAVEFSEIIRQFESVVQTLLQRTQNETYLNLEAGAEQVMLLSRLVNTVLTDLPPGHAQRVISCFCSRAL